MSEYEPYEPPADVDPAADDQEQAPHESDEPATKVTPALETVRLSHPESSTMIVVNAAHAWRYRQQGWRTATPAAPTSKATKAEWVAFAATRGLDRDEAAAMTKADLIAALS